jgi:cytoskeletal protein CcmA (bactofilin family)
MKNTARILLTLFFVLLIALVSLPALFSNPVQISGSLILPGALAQLTPPQQTPGSDKLVLGGSFILDDGETLEGDLFVLGGTAKLSEGSTVQGEIMVLGGTLTVDGQVDGSINVLGGLVSLGSSAHVGGDINTLSAQVDQEEGAIVDGKVNSLANGPYSVMVPGSFQLPNWGGIPPIALPKDVRTPRLDLRLNPLWDALWWLLRSFIWAALAVLVALFVPKQIERVASTAVKNPAGSGGLGCLTILIVPLFLILLAITICGLPFSMLGGFVLWVAWGFGVIVIGAETGRRLAELLRVDWAIPVTAGAGTFVLTLVSNGIGLLVPCIGWIIAAIIGVIGLGAVLLTRFGSRAYPESVLEPEVGLGSVQTGELDLPGSPLEPPDDTPEQDQGESNTK